MNSGRTRSSLLGSGTRIRAGRGGVAILGAVVLCACALGPQYQRPQIPVPSAWKNAPEDVAVSWPSPDWWRGFSSPQLDEYIGQAQRANDDIAAAVARVREADAQTQIVGARLQPAIAASAVAARQRTLASNGTRNTYTVYSPQISASYELDFWGKNRAALEAAQATLAAGRYDRATIELTVLSGVATTYFQALTLRERVEIAHRNLADAESILNGLRSEQKAGTVDALDVAQQETAVATLYASIPPLEQQFHASVNALAILLGKTPETVELAGGTLGELAQPAVVPGLPSELLARRPDVAEAEAQLIAANADIAQARAAFFPSIALTASGGFASTALSSVLNSANTVFSVAAALTQPIFQGGALEGQTAFTRARYEELLAGYHKTVLSALANVEDSLVGVQQTGEQERRQKEAVATARRAHEIAQARLNAGTINVLALLNTESALFAAEDAMAQIELSHMQALVGLFNALGGGWHEGMEQ